MSDVLPYDIKHKILHFLGPKEICNLAVVNKSFNFASKHPSVRGLMLTFVECLHTFVVVVGEHAQAYN